MAVIIVAALFALALIGLSIAANARFRAEPRLPMQWSLLRSVPLSRSVNWSAPRALALSFIPVLGCGVLAFFAVCAATLQPRPAQDWMVMPALIGAGSLLVAIHLLHLWLINRTLRGG